MIKWNQKKKKNEKIGKEKENETKRSERGDEEEGKKGDKELYSQDGNGCKSESKTMKILERGMWDGRLYWEKEVGKWNSRKRKLSAHRKKANGNVVRRNTKWETERKGQH